MSRKAKLERALELAIFSVDEDNGVQERLEAILEAESIRNELGVKWMTIGAAWDDGTIEDLIDGLRYTISRQP